MKTIVCVLLGILVFTGTAHAQQTYDDRHRISVTGESLVNVAPDRVIVTFGVDTRDMVLDTAKRQNDAIVKKALAAIKAMGIVDRDIQTDRLSIEQRFESPSGRQVFAGFTIRNMFVVSLSDPAKVDALITAALDSGVNYLLNVEFQTTELKKYREQARELATRAAREKAEKMAAALGETVGQALQIDEVGQNSGVSYYSSWSSGWGAGNRGNAGTSQNVVGVSSGDTVDTVALGKVGVRASVRVVFELIRR
ncbi:MAG TPA: SIMPL domain-containing protein [Vicinamibacterales bacterium]|nr:SIMPL domain-containing protein [Vicinamibacterales bacterium]